MKSFKQVLLESRLFEGYTEEQWRKLDSRTKQQYIKDHPNSKYAQKEVAGKSIVKNSKTSSGNSNKTSNKPLNSKAMYDLIKNPNTPKSILKNLDVSKMKTEERDKLTKDDKTSPIILDKFSTHKDLITRKWVAYNENTPKSTLKRMAKNDPVSTVRAAAQYNLDGGESPMAI